MLLVLYLIPGEGRDIGEEGGSKERKGEGGGERKRERELENFNTQG